MFRVQITSKFNFFFLTSIFMFLCNLLVGKWKRFRTQYGWQWSSNTTKILERMGNNKECKSGTSSRARLVLDLQPILTESMSGEDLPLLTELSKEMLQNAGIEQCFHKCWKHLFDIFIVCESLWKTWILSWRQSLQRKTWKWIN